MITIAANVEYAGTCPIFVAQEKGFFADENLVVEIQPHTSGKAALEAALEGKANLGTVADVPVMFAALSGKPVSVVAFGGVCNARAIGARSSVPCPRGFVRGWRCGAPVALHWHS